MYPEENMTLEELFTVYLRDCFNVGYTMPQFCVDNNIKKPLFVGIDESQANFLWEIHAQFQYDRRISINAEFALIKGEVKKFTFSLYEYCIQSLQLKNINDLDTSDYDKIIIMIARGTPNEKLIYMNELAVRFIKHTYSGIPLLNFIQKNPGVKIIQVVLPTLKKNPNNSDYEKSILEKEYTSVMPIRKEIELAQSKGETIQTPYDFLGYSNQEVYNLLATPERKLNPDGSVSMNDDEILHVENGWRVTANQPEYYKNKIYFFGGCITFGVGVPWDKTVESCLQKLLNKNKFAYRVENKATFNVTRVQDQFYNLNATKFNPGDIIFFERVFLHADDVPFFDCSRILDRPHNYGEVFPDEIGHLNENGHRALADHIFKVLVSNNFFKNTDFDYANTPPTPDIIINTVYRKKIFLLHKIIFKMQSWKNTRKNCVKKDYQSARLS